MKIKVYSYLIALFVLLLYGPVLSFATDVKDFGAKGDGKTDDRAAIMAALKAAEDGRLIFTKGRYLIRKTIDIPLSEFGPISISGAGVTGSVIMAGEGPAFRFIGTHYGSANPSSVKAHIWEQERMPTIYDIEIIGAHDRADGLEFSNTIQPSMRGLLIRNVRTGVHLTSRNRNIIISDSHIYNASGVGIFLDEVDIHQFIISDSHISYCKKGGIKVAGGDIRNFQLVGNDIEYNSDPNGMASADILIDCSQNGSTVREGTITGNTIQAVRSPGGANIRFIGKDGDYNNMGLWSITGNHLSGQDINIHLKQTRGINITGNNFIRGFDRNIVIENSRSILINGNVMDRNDVYFKNGSIPGGVLIDKSEGVVFSNNILEGIESKNENKGAALRISNSSYVTVNANQIRNPKYRGVYIEDSKNVMVADCMIVESIESPRMRLGISVEGACEGTIIQNNYLDPGIEGAIKNSASGVTILGNMPSS